MQAPRLPEGTQAAAACDGARNTFITGIHTITVSKFPLASIPQIDDRATFNSILVHTIAIAIACLHLTPCKTGMFSKHSHLGFSFLSFFLSFPISLRQQVPVDKPPDRGFLMSSRKKKPRGNNSSFSLHELWD